MAIVKYGAIITSIKGKIGGTVFQTGRSGGVAKNLNRHVAQQKGGVGQAGDAYEQAKTNFSVVTKSWSKATDVNRSSWSALLGIWTFINKFGDVYNGSAFQIFTACNINLRTLELPEITTAPVYNAANDLGLTFDDFSLAGTWNRTTTNAAAAGQYRVAYFSKPVSPTTPASKAKLQKVSVALVPAPGVFDLKSDYVAWLGYTPPLGSIFYVRVWTCWEDYPKIQFDTVYKIEVVA